MTVCPYNDHTPRDVVTRDPDLVIIDPSSPEFNRGSFCYLPYILTIALREQWGKRVLLLEDFTLAQLDKVPSNVPVLIALWSETQIDACRVLHRFLDQPHAYFGYEPYIRQEQLPLRTIKQGERATVGNYTEEEVRCGIAHYWRHIASFKHFLLSDCDLHLSIPGSTPTVYPMFTSYGCPNGCSFCPATVSCGRRRIPLDLSTVEQLIEQYMVRGYSSIHFTDEDFFYNTKRAESVLQLVCALRRRHKRHTNLIALGSAGTVLNYIKTYGHDTLERAGMRLIEVGLETASDALQSDMGKAGVVDKCTELAKAARVPILWLTMSLYPGESVSSLNATGSFLHRYGLRYEQLVPRIRTNGTEGGLGQFFQVYPGTPAEVDALQEGRVLTPRAVRLLPSYVPDSFLFSVVTSHRDVHSDKDERWFALYGTQAPDLDIVAWSDGLTISMLVQMMIDRMGMTYTDALVSVAICCRLRIFRGE